jgi:hypothetical protein
LSWSEPLSGQDLALTSIEVSDRLRRFDLPPIEQPLDFVVGRQARLVGYDLDLSQSQPGGRLHLRVVWQAEGPLVRPFKVFVHLLDDSGAIVSQHDAPPGDGCCPTNTWVEGEVIVDEHPLTLKADLPSGSYRLVAGMYDEDLNTRLPVYTVDGEQAAHDWVPLGRVTVKPIQQREQEATAVAEPRFKFDHHLFLPVVSRGEE